LVRGLLLRPELRFGAEVAAVLVEALQPVPARPLGPRALPVLVPQPLRRVERGVRAVEGPVQEERARRVPPFEEPQRLVGHPAGGMQALLPLPGTRGERVAADPRLLVVRPRIAGLATEELDVVVDRGGGAAGEPARG